MDDNQNQSQLLAPVKKVELNVAKPVVPKPVLDVNVGKTEAAVSSVQAVDKPKIETPAVKEAVVKEVIKAIDAADPLKKEEVKPVEEKVEGEKKEREAARWAAYTKQVRQLELDKASFKEEKKAIETQKQANLDFQKEVDSIKSNPKLALDILEKLGIPFTKLAEYILNPEVVDKDFEAKRFREQYENDKTAREKAEKDNLTRQEQNNIAEYKSALNKFIDGEDGNNNAYPLIRANAEHDLVYQVMNEQWMKDKTVMDRSVAAQAVETHLQEKLDLQLKAKKLNVVSETQSIGESEKVVNKEIKAINDKTVSQPAKSARIQKKTLTNLKTVSLTNPIQRAKTDKDRYARAAAALTKK
jgi:hypothetical protein